MLLMRSSYLTKTIGGLALALGVAYFGNFAREMVHYKRLSLLGEQDRIRVEMSRLNNNAQGMKVELASEYLRTLEARKCFDKAVYPFTSSLEIAEADFMYETIDDAGLKPVFHRLFVRKPSPIKGQCGAPKIVEPGRY